jgi:hypothetical protein
MTDGTPPTPEDKARYHRLHDWERRLWRLRRQIEEDPHSTEEMWTALQAEEEAMQAAFHQFRVEHHGMDFRLLWPRPDEDPQP